MSLPPNILQWRAALEVCFSRPATTDLRAIGAWIARDNPARAESFVEEIRVCCATLTEFPKAWPIDANSSLPDIRRRNYGQYFIFYRAELIAW